MKLTGTRLPVRAGWENWQGGFIRVGYPPPCQPPLVAAESSSPPPIPKNERGSLISCFQETFFPAAEFLVTSHRSVLFPGWCPIPFPEGCGLFHRLLNFHFHRSVHFYFSGVTRFLSKLSFGCDLWRSVSIHSEEWMARFPSVMSVSNSFSRRSNHWLGFI